MKKVILAPDAHGLRRLLDALEDAAVRHWRYEAKAETPDCPKVKNAQREMTAAENALCDWLTKQGRVSLRRLRRV